MDLLGDGTHLFSGVAEVNVQVGWPGDEEYADGIVMTIDGHDWLAYADPDDGYRSYGCLMMCDGKYKVPQFPAQVVHIKNYDEDGEDEDGWPRVFNKMVMTGRNGRLVLEIGTDHSDRWYPCAIFYYNPANLPINEFLDELKTNNNN